MSKGKKGGKRITKKQLSEQLEGFFSSQPEKTFSFKEIFRELHLDTHPAKMLAIETMEDMAWDDFLTKVSDGFLQVEYEGTGAGRHLREQGKRQELLPPLMAAASPIFVSERNSLSALNGDKVKVSFMARRRNHIKEAQVIEILSRKKDTFVRAVCVSTRTLLSS
jgi:ribonuclease R